MPLLAYALLQPIHAMGQPIIGSTTSIECTVLDADSVVVGHPIGFAQPDENGFAEGVVEVEATLKGRHRDRIPVRVQASGVSLTSWTRKGSRILFATKLNHPAITTAIDLGVDDLTVFTKSFARLSAPDDVLRAARKAIRERPGVTRIRTLDLRLPPDRVRGTKLGAYSGAMLIVPVDRGLEAWARKAVRGDQDRAKGVEVLRYFRSDENLELVMSLLDDPTTGFLDRAEDNEGREVLLFTVREAAAETLRYWGESFDEPVLRRVSLRLDRVKSVSRSNTKVSAAELRKLKRFANLESLFLWNSNVADDHLKEVARLTNLRELYLAGTKVTDAGLAHLAVLGKLRYVDLAGTAVSDNGLETLAKFESLEKLSLDNVTGVTEEGLRRLARQRPDLEIER